MTDSASERRKLRSVGAYPDPFLVTRLPVEVTVVRGVVEVGEKSLLGFVDQPFADGTRVRVLYDGWLFAEVVDSSAAVDTPAHDTRGSQAGREPEFQVAPAGSGQAHPGGETEPHSSSENPPTSESDEPAAGVAQSMSEPHEPTPHEDQPSKVDESTPDDPPWDKEPLGGEEQKVEPEAGSDSEPLETAAGSELPASNYGLRPSGEDSGKKPVPVVRTGGQDLQPELFPEDLTRSDPASTGDSPGQRDSWTDAFRTKRRSNGEEEQ